MSAKKNSEHEQTRNILIKIHGILLDKGPTLLATLGSALKADLRKISLRLQPLLSKYPALFNISLNEKKAEIASLVSYPNNLTLCPAFALNAACANDIACPFLHGEHDSRLKTETNEKDNVDTKEELQLGDFLIEKTLSVKDIFSYGALEIQQLLTDIAKKVFELVKHEDVALKYLELQLQAKLQLLPGVTLADLVQHYNDVFEYREDIVSLKVYTHLESLYQWKMCLPYIIDGECANGEMCRFKHAAADQRAVPHGVTVTYQGHVTPHSTAVELVDRAPKCSRKEQKLLQRIKRILRGLRNEAALDSVMTPKITRALNRLNITLRDFVAQHPELELCTKSDGAEVLSLHSTSNGTHKQEKQVHLALSDVQLVNEDDAYVISYHNDALICSRALLHWLILTLRHKMNQGLLSEIETYAKCQKQLSKLNITLRDFALRYPTKFELSYTKANTEKIVLKEDRLPLMCQIRKLLRAADGNELRLAELEGDNICSTELSRLLIASVREFVGYYPFMFKITKDENGAELVQLKKKTKKANNNNQPGSGAPLPVKPPEPQLHTADSIVNLPQPIVSKEVPLTNAVPSDDSIKWVRTALDAHHARKLLSTVNIVAVDAEYQRDQICLVQVRAGALTLLFDLCDAVHSKDLALCLKELMHNGELVKVFHDSRQDTYYLNKLEIRDIKALVDTQVLYQMNQELKKQPEKRIGLGPLLRLCGFEHALKDQVHGQMDRGQVDWSKRPLPEHLIRYAAADVAHLIPLFEALERERKELTYRLYDTYSTSMLRADRAGANQTYLERAAIKTNEKYQLVFSEDKKPNYHPIGTLSNVTTTDHSAQLVQRQNDKELADLIHTLPEHIRSAVSQLIRAEQKQVVEIIIDYAKPICLRFEDRSERTIEAVVDNLAEFIDSLQAKTQAEFRRDNRMGLEGTLHRISVIKNKDDKPVGLTYRIGRHIQNSCALIEDVIHTIIASQQKAASTPISLLLLGPPGVGKTTLLREISARLSDVLGRTVMIIDTSNEIGGDGDAPHECIGNARRMQVPDHKGQHDVMLEAIKNHNPSVIVIDEIGTAAEVKAAKTIGQRGVQLVATAHGTTLDSLMKNPELVALIGGIQPVFVGDRDAVRKEDGSKEKIILQRAGDPTFNIIIEMHRKHTWRIYTNVSQVIDAKLAKKPYSAELRWIDQSEGQLLAVIETHNSETANHTSLHWLDMYKQH